MDRMKTAFRKGIEGKGKGKEEGSGGEKPPPPPPPPYTPAQPKTKQTSTKEDDDDAWKAAVQIINYQADYLRYLAEMYPSPLLYKSKEPMCRFLGPSQRNAELDFSGGILDIMSAYRIPIDTINVSKRVKIPFKDLTGLCGFDLIAAGPYGRSIILDNDKRFYNILSEPTRFAPFYKHFAVNFSLAVDLAFKRNREIRIYPMYCAIGTHFVLKKETFEDERLNIMTWLRSKLRAFCTGNHVFAGEDPLSIDTGGLTHTGFYSHHSNQKTWCAAYRNIMREADNLHFFPLLNMHFSAQRPSSDTYWSLNGVNLKAFYNEVATRLSRCMLDRALGDAAIRESIVHLSSTTNPLFEGLDNDFYAGHSLDCNQLAEIELRHITSQTAMIDVEGFDKRGGLLLKCHLPMDIVADTADEKFGALISSKLTKPRMKWKWSKQNPQGQNFWHLLSGVDYSDKKEREELRQYYTRLCAHIRRRQTNLEDHPIRLIDAAPKGTTNTAFPFPVGSPEWHNHMAGELRRAWEAPKVKLYTLEHMAFTEANFETRRRLIAEAQNAHAIPHPHLPPHFENQHATGPGILTPQYHETRAGFLTKHINYMQGNPHTEGTSDFRRFEADRKRYNERVELFNTHQAENTGSLTGHWNADGVWVGDEHPVLGPLGYYSNRFRHPAYIAGADLAPRRR